MQEHTFFPQKETIYSLRYTAQSENMMHLWDTRSHRAKGRVREQERGLVPNARSKAVLSLLPKAP